MNPHQLAKTECANYEPDGGCLGIDIAPDGQSSPLWPKKPARCVLADEQPCPYFEEAILAGIPMIRSEQKTAEWQEAEENYNGRKRKHEHRFSEGSLERTGDDGTLRLHQETTAPAHVGRRASGNKTPERIVRLSGRGRAKVAC